MIPAENTVLVALIVVCDRIDDLLDEGYEAADAPVVKLFAERNDLVEAAHAFGAQMGLLEAITGSSKDNLKHMLRNRRRRSERALA